MDWDDQQSRAAVPTPRNLEVMGVAELNAYINELETEIARVRAAVAAKLSARAGAESVFKK